MSLKSAGTQVSAEAAELRLLENRPEWQERPFQLDFTDETERAKLLATVKEGKRALKKSVWSGKLPTDMTYDERVAQQLDSAAHHLNHWDEAVEAGFPVVLNMNEAFRLMEWNEYPKTEATLADLNAHRAVKAIFDLVFGDVTGKPGSVCSTGVGPSTGRQSSILPDSFDRPPSPSAEQSSNSGSFFGRKSKVSTVKRIID